MPDFTPAEIADAIKNPRPGDVWVIALRDGVELERSITRIDSIGVWFDVTVKKNTLRGLVQQIAEWRYRNTDATLVRRGA